MRRPLPPLAWFRAFDSAARQLSFTAAARELHLTQSAISQQVRALEERLGAPLFQRKPRGLALTDAGRRLLPDVTDALATLTEATRGFDLGAGTGLITVAASVSFSRWFITPMLPAFLAAHPGCRLRIVSTIWPDDFHASLADVEIRFGGPSLVGSDARRLLPDELVVVASPELARRPLVELPLVATVGTADDWDHFAGHTGIDQDITPSLFVDNYGLAIELATAGVGVALASSLLAAPAINDGRLVRLHPGSAPARDGYFLAVRRDAAEPATAFARWLHGVVEAATAGQTGQPPLG